MTEMPGSAQSLLRLTLAGQALLQPDPSLIAVPSDAEGGLADEIRLAQAVPDAAAQEYTRLFLNPTGVECHLWQSVHADEPRLFGPEHLAALEWFRRYGAEPQRSNEPADHLGLLLLFYARLIEGGDSAGDAEVFFREHIAWAGEFASKLRQQACHPLYLALAREIQAILAEDAAQAM